jgi:hypothetical protein
MSNAEQLKELYRVHSARCTQDVAGEPTSSPPRGGGVCLSAVKWSTGGQLHCPPGVLLGPKAAGPWHTPIFLSAGIPGNSCTFQYELELRAPLWQHLSLPAPLWSEARSRGAGHHRGKADRLSQALL